MIELNDPRGKTLDLLDYGRIGQAIAGRATTFDIRILVNRRHGAAPDKSTLQVENLEQLFAEANYLMLAAPLPPQTRHIVNAQSLAWAKLGRCIIKQTDRSSCASVCAGRRQIGLRHPDVSDPEPRPEGHPLYTHLKVRITPHISYSSDGHFVRPADLIMENFDRFIASMPLLGIVDPQGSY